MAGSSTTRPVSINRKQAAQNSTGSATKTVEEAWVLVGRRRGRVWLMRKIGYAAGSVVSVEFHGASALVREERKGDVVGFLHTHPSSTAQPSRRDLVTMRAWVAAFGKPLLCLIRGTDGLKAYRFDDDASAGQLMATAEEFPRGVLVAVDPIEK